MQHEEPRIVNLTLLQREEESHTVTFDCVEIVLILLLLLITVAKRVFFNKNKINREAADVTDHQETTVKKTSSALSAVETSQ